MFKRLVLAVCLQLALAACAQDVTPVLHAANPPNTPEQQAKPYVVMVSLDGFRYDYAKLHGASHLDAMAADGASTPDGMLPSFPSVTFPNHWTLVTGLRPEHHGIVEMHFYDPARKQSFSYSKDETAVDGSWYGGTPLWVLAEKQGMRSACLFWPGSSAEVQGIRPSYYLKFDDKLDDHLRIDQIIAWLKLPAAERPHFLTLYYSDTDHAGHHYGPDSAEVHEAVHHVDALIGELREKLQATGLPVDLIVTADHGMIKLDPTPVVLDTFADLKDVRYEGFLLYPETEARAEAIYRAFRSHPDPRFTAYRRKDVPSRLAFDANPREGDPVLIPNGPYTLTVHPLTKPPLVATHGFDAHTMPEMKAIFYVEGPDIRPGVKLKSFDNVDVYPFVAKLLGLTAPRTDGSIEPLVPALRK